MTRPLTTSAFAAALTLAAVTANAQPQAGARTGVLPEPAVIRKSIDLAIRTIGQGSDTEKSGFYPEMANMITGAGWISGGPGYRQWLLGDRLFLDGSAAVSWRLYRMAQARAELTNLARGRIVVGTQARWQDATQITWFGEGPASRETDRSEYRLTSTDIAGYAALRPARWLSIGGSAGWLAAPRLREPGGAFQRGYPDAGAVFPADPVFARAEQPSYAHGEASITADTRDHRSHPSRGGVFRAAWSRYADRANGAFTFDRYEAEAAAFVPLAASRVVVALRGWTIGSSTASGRTVPLYLLPSLGGGTTLRGDADYRFHDRNVALVNAEGRVALFAHVDAAVFADAGSVAPRWSLLGLSRRSYGAGLRLHTGPSTLVRLDVAHGAEGWRVLLRTSDALHLSRLSRHTAALPFVP
jgi:hypothetical protein